MNRKLRNKLKGKFASIFEKRVYEDAIARGIRIEYEPRSFKYLKSPSRGSTCKSCGSRDIAVPGSYTPDFCVAGRIYIEAKGYFNAAKRSLMASFVRSNPDLDLRFIFAQNNWLTKKKANRYSDWAEKLGIKYHIGDKIPEEWLTDDKGEQK